MIIIIDFSWLESIDKFVLFLAVFGWYDSSEEKFIIFILFKLFITHLIQDTIFHNYTKKKLDKEKIVNKKKQGNTL